MTYEQLLTALKQYVEDTSTEFSTVFPTFLRNAEERISRDLQTTLAHYSEGTPVSLSALTYTLSLITSYDALRWVEVYTGNTRYYPVQRDISYIRSIYPDPVTTSTSPFRYYGFINASTIQFAPVSTNPHTVKIGYMLSLSGLTAGNSTWLSNNYPDLLLFAVLIESEVFHKSPELKNLYMADYQTALANAKQKELTRRQDYTNINGVF